MKINAKFTMLQSAVILGFIITISFVLIRFNQARELKLLELNASVVLTELNTLINKTELFSVKSENLNLLWEDWETSYKRLLYLYAQIIDSPAKNIIPSHELVHLEEQERAWQSIRENEIESLMLVMQNYTQPSSIKTLVPESDDRSVVFTSSSPLQDYLGNKSIALTIEQLNSNSNQNDKIVASNLKDLVERFDQIISHLKINSLLPAQVLIVELEAWNTEFTSSLLYTTLILAILIQLGSAIFAYLFCRKLDKNIVTFERNLADVANGKFDVDLEIRSNDELQNIATNFKVLTEDLWSRVDSLKTMLHEIGVRNTYDSVESQAVMLQLAIEYANANAGGILMLDTNSNKLHLTQKKGFIPPPAPIPNTIERTEEAIIEWYTKHESLIEFEIFNRLLTHCKPEFIRHNLSDMLPYNSDPQSLTFISSAIFIPLIVSGKPIGILYITNSSEDHFFSDLDYSYMQIYGEVIAISLDSISKYELLIENQKLNKEIEIAATIQKTMLPSRMPKIKGVKIAAYSKAAKGVSGDYYDVFKLYDNKLVIVICDVSGKGVPASLLMIMIRTLIRTITTPLKTSSQILYELNKFITTNANTELFATVSVLIVNVDDQTISYANGAHHPLYILRSSTGKYRLFDAEGLPIGIDMSAKFNSKKIRVSTGDYLILFTDGLVEARDPDGKELGTEAVLKFVAKNSRNEPEELIKRTQSFIQQHGGSNVQYDDQTLVALQID